MRHKAQTTIESLLEAGRQLGYEQALGHMIEYLVVTPEVTRMGMAHHLHVLACKAEKERNNGLL